MKDAKDVKSYRCGPTYLGLSPRDISQAMKTDVGEVLASFIHDARTAGCEESRCRRS